MIDCDSVIKDHVLGVFPANQLPDVRMGRSFGLICNTHIDSMPGEHWISIFGDGKGYLEFFDSFGRTPASNSNYIALWLGKRSKAVNINRIKLQGDYSNVCGLYCILFLRARFLGVSMEDFVNSFDLSNTYANDQYVLDVLSSAYDQCFTNENVHNQICTSLILCF
jgi:hypothetical protein